jgi:hypothetical protein
MPELWGSPLEDVHGTQNTPFRNLPAVTLSQLQHVAAPHRNHVAGTLFMHTRSLKSVRMRAHASGHSHTHTCSIVRLPSSGLTIV